MSDLAHLDTSPQYWIDLALRPDVLTRSMRVALVVGTVLVLINYVDRLVGPALQPIDFLKISLTYVVPYCVSTYASMRSLHRDC